MSEWVNLDYNDCLNYIKNELHINLTPYQTRMVMALCEGKTIIGSRGRDQTMCLRAIHQYMEHLVEDWNPREEKII